MLIFVSWNYIMLCWVKLCSAVIVWWDKKIWQVTVSPAWWQRTNAADITKSSETRIFPGLALMWPALQHQSGLQTELIESDAEVGLNYTKSPLPCLYSNKVDTNAGWDMTQSPGLQKPYICIEVRIKMMFTNQCIANRQCIERSKRMKNLETNLEGLHRWSW